MTANEGGDSSRPAHSPASLFAVLSLHPRVIRRLSQRCRIEWSVAALLLVTGGLHVWRRGSFSGLTALSLIETTGLEGVWLMLLPLLYWGLAEACFRGVSSQPVAGRLRNFMTLACLVECLVWLAVPLTGMGVRQLGLPPVWSEVAIAFGRVLLLSRLVQTFYAGDFLRSLVVTAGTGNLVLLFTVGGPLLSRSEVTRSPMLGATLLALELPLLLGMWLIASDRSSGRTRREELDDGETSRGG